MAAQWGIPPWLIEDEAPALWVDRWVALHNARNRPRKPAKGKRLL